MFEVELCLVEFMNLFIFSFYELFLNYNYVFLCLVIAFFMWVHVADSRAVICNVAVNIQPPRGARKTIGPREGSYGSIQCHPLKRSLRGSNTGICACEASVIPLYHPSIIFLNTVCLLEYTEHVEMSQSSLLYTWLKLIAHYSIKIGVTLTNIEMNGLKEPFDYGGKSNDCVE